MEILNILNKYPNKCLVYLGLPYLGKKAKFLENQIRETVNSSFGSVNLRITHSTRKPLNGIVIKWIYSKNSIRPWKIRISIAI